MKRLTVLITTLGLLALPATALAQGECPSTMKPIGKAYGGLLGSTVTLDVETANSQPNPIETSHGAVHWEVVPGSQYIFAEQEPNRMTSAKRAYGSLSTTFVGPMEGEWFVSVSEEYRVWGPGSEFEPYWVNYDGQMNHCTTASYTPYKEGVLVTRFGESRPIG